MTSSEPLFHLGSNKYTIIPCSCIEGGWQVRVNHQGIHNTGRQVSAEQTPIRATICTFKHTKLKCPYIESSWRLRVNRHRENISSGQASVGRTPVYAAIDTFEQAAGICPCINGGRCLRVNRQGTKMDVSPSQVSDACAPVWPPSVLLNTVSDVPA
jgi:hypothetical protein